MLSFARPCNNPLSHDAVLSSKHSLFPFLSVEPDIPDFWDVSEKSAASAAEALCFDLSWRIVVTPANSTRIASKGLILVCEEERKKMSTVDTLPFLPQGSQSNVNAYG